MVTAAALSLLASAALTAPGFEVADYGRLQRFREAGISPAGTHAFYVTETAEPGKPSATRRVSLVDVRSGVSTVIEILSPGRSFAWRDNGALAYICPSKSGAQVCVYDLAARTSAAVTDLAEPVTAFMYSGDGTRLAVITQPAPPPGESFFDRTRNGKTGIVFDLERNFADEFFTFVPFNAPPRNLVLVVDGKATEVKAPGSVEAAYWDASGKKLSFRYSPANSGQGMAIGSIALLDPGSGRIETLFAGVEAGNDAPRISYGGGAWDVATGRLRVFRSTQEDGHLWRQSRDTAVVDPAAPASAVWMRSEFAGMEPRVIDDHKGRLLVEDVRLAHRSLFTGYDKPEVAFLADTDDDATMFSRSRTGKFLFVRQSLTKPPELFTSDGRTTRQLTRANADIARRIDFTARELWWKSRDGRTIEGWLLEPEGKTGPLPMVTYLHGGPGIPITNAFEESAEGWPHPIAALASSGFAVFLPNYRGTASFGASHARPSRPDGEPVDDVVTGVEKLVADGVADRARLGIMGYSAGAWLAPMVALRSDLFLAGNASEGWSNQFGLYNATPGWLNRQVHDPNYGGPPWQIPQRYIELSLDLNFSHVKTRFLLEGGAKKAGPSFGSLAKAAHRAGAPVEYIVYPRTPHALIEPDLRLESAARLVDWMHFWLTGREDSDPAKVEQYQRWRRLRGAATSTD